jgi:hypothetical protein
MGLDMYASIIPATELKGKEVDFPIEMGHELFYWRKHPNLHGWMESLYRVKGGAADSFNTVNLNLNIEDLNNLEEVINNKVLPETSGFFFGESDPKRKEEDLKFIRKAKKALKHGYAVVYSSWW